LQIARLKMADREWENSANQLVHVMTRVGLGDHLFHVGIDSNACDLQVRRERARSTGACTTSVRRDSWSSTTSPTLTFPPSRSRTSRSGSVCRNDRSRSGSRIGEPRTVGRNIKTSLLRSDSAMQSQQLLFGCISAASCAHGYGTDAISIIYGNHFVLI